LENEVGPEIDIAWKTSTFFFKGTFKTGDMGTVVKLLAMAKYI
jgi:hypothetical protein